MPQARANFRALSGDYRLSGGTLEARNVQGDVLGGKVSGELTLTHLSERPTAQVTAAVHDVSLEAISAALDTKPLERAAISGIVQGRLEGSWEGRAKCPASCRRYHRRLGSGSTGGRNRTKCHSLAGQFAPGLCRSERRDVPKPVLAGHVPLFPQGGR